MYLTQHFKHNVNLTTNQTKTNIVIVNVIFNEVNVLKFVNVPFLKDRKLINKGKMPLQLVLFGLCENITINDSLPRS